MISPFQTNSDFDAKPMVMLLGQYSTGKTTFIKHLLKCDYPGWLNCGYLVVFIVAIPSFIKLMTEGHNYYIDINHICSFSILSLYRSTHWTRTNNWQICRRHGTKNLFFVLALPVEINRVQTEKYLSVCDVIKFMVLLLAYLSSISCVLLYSCVYLELA